MLGGFLLQERKRMNKMTKEEMIQRSIEKVKTKLLLDFENAKIKIVNDLETFPSRIRDCYGCAENDFENKLTDILIDASMKIKSKEQLRFDSINLKH